jgi:hypothetical protein
MPTCFVQPGQSGDLYEPIDDTGANIGTLEYMVFSKCDSDFRLEILVRSIGESRVTSDRVKAINAPPGYGSGWHHELGRDPD